MSRFRLFFCFLLISALVSLGSSKQAEADSVYDFLREQGYLPEDSNSASSRPINIFSLPPQLIPQIQATPLRTSLDVTEEKVINEKIIRTKRLTFNPKSQLTWLIGNYDDNIVVLATENLTLNLPGNLADLPKLRIIPPISTSNLHGNHGGQGATGWSSGRDDGQDARQGAPGDTGGAGRTYKYPTVYILYQTITINPGNPSTSQGLTITAAGLTGGNGGNGGKGGTGGYGSRGTPGDRNCVLGICTCSAGPGRGGNGGDGGPGGRGGDAGRGGDGASVLLIGPKAEFSKLDRIGTILTAGKAGTPGAGGGPGDGGGEGGGGSKPWECPDGGGSGNRGNAASNPPTLGPGGTKPNGLDGGVFLADRNNTDLF